MYVYKTPNKYPNTRWMTDDLDMYFEVMDSGKIKGELIVKGEIIQLVVPFDYAKGVEFCIRPLRDYRSINNRSYFY